MSNSKFQLLISDIGGVLGTNGWDTQLRQKVVETFRLDAEEVERRHHLMFDSYECGYMSFDEYLKSVVFYKAQSFSLEGIREYVFAGSVAWPQNISLFGSVKKLNRLKFALLSNEGQGITEHRIGKFGLREVADYMVVSHFVHMRKPDPQIWQLALDLAQVEVSEAIYVDDRMMFVEVARGLGFASFQHTSVEDSRENFRKLGLQVE